MTVLVSSCGSGTGKLVVDSRTGLSYRLPEGWNEKPKQDLIEFFSSAAGSGQPGDRYGGIMGTGPLAGLFAAGEQGLKAQAQSAAIGFAEFFVPYEGSRRFVTGKAVKVGGRNAYRVRLMVKPDSEKDAVVEVVVVNLEGKDAFAMGVVQPASDRRTAKGLQQALDSLQVSR